MSTTVRSRFRMKTGNQLVAEAAVRAGCRFFAGYPITPASGIYKTMIDLLPQRGDVAVSAPDEISALAYCVGASMRGYKTMTATSGPGWALMTETVQYALMTETPVVIALVQRLGPSTGGATQGAQGDIWLAEFCTSGGYTIPVFCPSTPKQCHDLTLHAFSCSELLRTPVVLLLDKETGMTLDNVDDALFDSFSANRVTLKDETGEISGRIPMYGFRSRGDVPAFFPVGEHTKVTATGSAHNKFGELKKNDRETIDVLLHLEEKIRAHASELTVVENSLEAGAQTLIISYGITARTTKEVVRKVRMNGKSVSFVNVNTLFPIPSHALQEAAQGVRRVLIAEENMQGQYRTMIRHLFPTQEIVGINRIGSMITPSEIIDKVLV